MRYALIGCGRIARNHMKAMRENGLELVAVCDVLPEKMEALLAENGMSDAPVRRYTDYQALLDAEQPTLAAVATPSGLHAQIALACIQSGVHVIIEKPMAMSMADARRIVDESCARGVKVCACHQNRFNLAVQQTRAALTQGRLGKLSHAAVEVRWNRGRAYYEQATWRGTWAEDGGCLMNQCIHGIDLLRWMLGDELTSVYGVTRRQFHDYLEAEDVGMAVLQFPNGAIATVEGTTNVYPKNLEETLYLFGEKGTLKLGGTSMNNIDLWDFAQPADADEQNRTLREHTENVYGNGHTPLYADMIAAITEGREPYVDAEAGLRAVETVLAIYQSQKTGLPVTLPLADFASTDMEGVF